MEESERREERVIKDLAKQRDKEINKQIEYKETLDKLHIYEETYYEALKKLSEPKGDWSKFVDPIHFKKMTNRNRVLQIRILTYSYLFLNL